MIKKCVAIFLTAAMTFASEAVFPACAAETSSENDYAYRMIASEDFDYGQTETSPIPFDTAVFNGGIGFASAWAGDCTTFTTTPQVKGNVPSMRINGMSKRTALCNYWPDVPLYRKLATSLDFGKNADYYLTFCEADSTTDNQSALNWNFSIGNKHIYIGQRYNETPQQGYYLQMGANGESALGTVKYMPQRVYRYILNIHTNANDVDIVRAKVFLDGKPEPEDWELTIETELGNETIDFINLNSGGRAAYTDAYKIEEYNRDVYDELSRITDKLDAQTADIEDCKRMYRIIGTLPEGDHKDACLEKITNYTLQNSEYESSKYATVVSTTLEDKRYNLSDIREFTLGFSHMLDESTGAFSLSDGTDNIDITTTITGDKLKVEINGSLQLNKEYTLLAENLLDYKGDAVMCLGVKFRTSILPRINIENNGMYMEGHVVTWDEVDEVDISCTIENAQGVKSFANGDILSVSGENILTLTAADGDITDSSTYKVNVVKKYSPEDSTLDTEGLYSIVASEDFNYGQSESNQKLTFDNNVFNGGIGFASPWAADYNTFTTKPVTNSAMVPNMLWKNGEFALSNHQASYPLYRKLSNTVDLSKSFEYVITFTEFDSVPAGNTGLDWKFALGDSEIYIGLKYNDTPKAGYYLQLGGGGSSAIGQTAYPASTKYKYILDIINDPNGQDRVRAKAFNAKNTEPENWEIELETELGTGIIDFLTISSGPTTSIVYPFIIEKYNNKTIDLYNTLIQRIEDGTAIITDCVDIISVILELPDSFKGKTENLNAVKGYVSSRGWESYVYPPILKRCNISDGESCYTDQFSEILLTYTYKLTENTGEFILTDGTENIALTKTVDGNIIKLSLESELKQNREYTLTGRGIKDVKGDVAQDAVITFKTMLTPSVNIVDGGIYSQFKKIVWTEIPGITVSAKIINGNQSNECENGEQLDYIGQCVLLLSATDGIKTDSRRIGFNLTKAEMPIAKNLIIKGTAETGEILKASYEYYDANTDEEKDSIIRWERSTKEDGVYTEIPGEYGLTHTLTEEDNEHYIRFTVIPVSDAEALPVGEKATSAAFVGPFAPQANNVRIEKTAGNTDYLVAYYDIVDKNGDECPNTRVYWTYQNQTKVLSDKASLPITFSNQTVVFHIEPVSTRRPYNGEPVEIAYTVGSSGSGGSGGSFSYAGKTSGSKKEDIVTSPNQNKPTEVLPKGVFSDTKNHWAKDYIKVLVDEGVLNGVNENEFEPDRNITRAEYIAVLVRGLGDIEKAPYNGEFEDVNSQAWYADYVSYALKHNLIAAAQQFRPDAPITRAEAAKIISHYLNIASDDDVSFLDSDEIPQWALESVKAVFAHNVMIGDDKGMFNPNNSLTRAECSTIIYRILNSEGSK